MTAERESMTLQEMGAPALGVEERRDEALCLPFISSGVHQERRPVRRHW